MEHTKFQNDIHLSICSEQSCSGNAFPAQFALNKQATSSRSRTAKTTPRFYHATLLCADISRKSVVKTTQLVKSSLLQDIQARSCDQLD